MQFRIRPPFSVHDEQVNTIVQAGQTIKQPVIKSHYQNDTVDFDTKTAKLHLHKLEPLDDAAKALCKEVHDANEIVANARGGGKPAPTLEDIQAMIDEGIKKGLAAQQKSTKS